MLRFRGTNGVFFAIAGFAIAAVFSRHRGVHLYSSFLHLYSSTFVLRRLSFCNIWVVKLDFSQPKQHLFLVIALVAHERQATVPQQGVLTPLWQHCQQITHVTAASLFRRTGSIFHIFRNIRRAWRSSIFPVLSKKAAASLKSWSVMRSFVVRVFPQPVRQHILVFVMWRMAQFLQAGSSNRGALGLLYLTNQNAVPWPWLLDCHTSGKLLVEIVGVAHCRSGNARCHRVTQLPLYYW